MSKKILMILSPTISSSCLMINPYFFAISIIQNCILHSLSVYKCLSLSLQSLAQFSCHFSRKFLLPLPTTHWIRSLPPTFQFLMQTLSYDIVSILFVDHLWTYQGQILCLSFLYPKFRTVAPKRLKFVKGMNAHNLRVFIITYYIYENILCFFALIWRERYTLFLKWGEISFYMVLNILWYSERMASSWETTNFAFLW